MNEESSKSIDPERFDILHKELVVVQDVIKRMSSTSFLVKGWSVTLVVATLLVKNQSGAYWVALLPLLVFWYLDSFFLYQERLYRELYNWVSAHRLETDDFLFNLNAYRFDGEEGTEEPPDSWGKFCSVVRCMFSWSSAPFYLFQGVLVLLLSFLKSAG